jgi:hypothetical protein
MSAGVVVNELKDSAPPPTLDHESHHSLEMFRRSAHLIHRYFSKLLAASALSREEKDVLEKMLEANQKYPIYSAEYVEKTWTRRLHYAMTVHLPHLNPKLTMDLAKGGGFAKNILAKWSRLDGINANCVPFRGAPDITSNNLFVVVADNSRSDTTDGDTTDDTDTEMIEIATRSKLSLTAGLLFCPEKAGELAAAMLTKCFCSVLKDISLQKNVSTSYKSHGLLLNRNDSEAIQCEMEMKTTFVGRTRTTQPEVISPTEISVHLQPATTAEELCQALHYFT